MFGINEDKSINITRGDIGAFTVDALNEAGEKYLFQKGDVVRIKVTEKKACENVMFQKDFVVEEETEQVEILLTEEETKIGEVISKPTDYWYEIELNPLTNPQTIIGYDEDGAKIFKLFPEGKDVGSSDELTPEDIPLVDDELDLTSDRPVQNQAIARAFLNIQEEIFNISIGGDLTKEDLDGLVTDIDTNKTNIAANTGKIEDLTNNTQELANALDTHKADTSNPHNVTAEQISYDGKKSVKGAIDELIAKEWTLLGNGASSCDISNLPDNAEIYVLILFKEANSWLDAIEFNLQKQIINTSNGDYWYYTKGAYASATQNSQIRIGVNSNYIQLNQAYLNGVDIINTTGMYVYWR